MIRKTHETHWRNVTGTGTISTLFVKDLILTQSIGANPIRHVIQAVATSSRQKAVDFLEETAAILQSPTIYTTHEDLYADSRVDVVYVGLPHFLHKPACLASIAAGKHVLCEKPMAINAREIDEIVALARQKQVFLMEGVCNARLPPVKHSDLHLKKKQLCGLGSSQSLTS